MLVLQKPQRRAILILAFAAAVMSILAWIARNDPTINFLLRDPRAEWIVFPVAIDAQAHGSASFDATFRREFGITDSGVIIATISLEHAMLVRHFSRGDAGSELLANRDTVALCECELRDNVDTFHSSNLDR
jgi:hypothetical protein